MKVFYNGEQIEINKDTVFFVGKVSSGQTVFGEKAKFEKALKNNLVFKTDSGAIVKTEIDTLNTVGKAKKEGYFVSVRDRSNDENTIIQVVSYWNGKKCCFENK